jgi:hypothetical protein
MLSPTLALAIKYLLQILHCHHLTLFDSELVDTYEFRLQASGFVPPLGPPALCNML